MAKQLLLVTGAAGFVGQYALRFALRPDSPYDAVIATDISYVVTFDTGAILEREWMRGRYHFVESNLTRREEVAHLIKATIDVALKRGCNEIIIWHIGGLFRYDAPFSALYDVNVLGTENLLMELHRIISRLKRFVFWSGGVVYGDFNHPRGVLPAAEDYPVCPNNDYGWSKKIAEDRLRFFSRTFGFPVTIMRLAAIYGPDSNYGMANAFELNYLGKLAPLLVGKKTNRPALIHAEDVIRVADFLSHAPEAIGETYNVVDDSHYTMDEVNFAIGRAMDNAPFRHFHLPAWVLRRLIRKVKRAAQELGVKPIIDPGLGDMVLPNSFMSNYKLRELAKRHGRDDLLLYGDSLAGLTVTLPWYKEHFDYKYGRK